jgi:hypothetical protein
LLEEAQQTILALLIRIARWRRDEILRYALAGDWAPLAKYIRGGGRVTPKMRPFLADVLNGKRGRPSVKISRLATKKRNSEIARFILQARERGEKEKKYSEAAEKKFGRTWRHLQKILANEKEKTPDWDKALPTELHALFGHLENPLQAGIRLVRLQKGVPPSDNGVIKYELSDTALSPHTLT